MKSDQETSQAVSVYILCRSGSYLPYLTCDCANFHVCLSPACSSSTTESEFIQLCYRQRGETKQAS